VLASTIGIPRSSQLIVAEDVVLSADVVEITWSDGHVSRYPHRELRIECACAGCIEEMTGRRILDVLSVPGDVFAVDYLEVGKYALQFAWSDGHATGIYPFTMLRKICRCGEEHSSDPASPEQGPRRAGR
jgi:DUF971 family protein